MVRVAVDIVCMGRDETSVKTWQILELAVLEQTDDLSLYPSTRWMVWPQMKSQ